MINLNKLSKIVNSYFNVSNILKVSALDNYSNLQLVECLSKLTNNSFNKDIIYKWIDDNKNIIDKLHHRSFFYLNNGIITITNYKDAKTGFISVFKLDEEDLKYFNVTQTYFIKGADRVPDIYIILGNEIGQTSKELIKNIDLAFYDFIAAALDSMFKSYINMNIISKFIKDNKQTIDSIRSNFEYSTPKLLGRGTDGVAFQISDDKILKIFKDAYSYSKALEAFNRLYSNKEVASNEAMVYDIGIIGKIQNQLGTEYNVYYYIMEKMQPVRTVLDNNIIDYNLSPLAKAIKDDIVYLHNLTSKLAPLLYDKKDYKLFIKEFENYATQISKDMLNDDSTKVYIEEINKLKLLQSNWLQDFVKEILFKIVSGRTDLHFGNLGITSYKKFRYFDPAYNSFNENVNM